MLHICKADLGVEPSLPCQGLQYYSLLRCYPTSLSFCSQHSKMSSHMPLNSMCLLPDMLTETSFSTCTLPMTPPTLLQALLEGDSSPGREKERAWPCWQCSTPYGCEGSGCHVQFSQRDPANAWCPYIIVKNTTVPYVAYWKKSHSLKYFCHPSITPRE